MHINMYNNGGTWLKTNQLKGGRGPWPACFELYLLYLSTSSPPVEAGGSKPTHSVLPSTASRVTLDGASLGCGRGMMYGVSATAEEPAQNDVHEIEQ